MCSLMVSDLQSGEISRNCTVCGKELSIRLFDDGSYSGGHFFGKVRFPVGEGENKKVGTSDILGEEVDVVEWTGDHEEIEYWECDYCCHDK